MFDTVKLLFSYDFIVRAMIAGGLVALCCALLGVSLVLKRFSMIGDGLSHVGFGALSVAAVMNVAPLAIAVPVVIVAAFFILKLGKDSKVQSDSAIALVSSVAIAAGVTVTSLSGGLNTDVYSYMFGSILAMSRTDVYISVILSVIVLILFFIFYHKIFAITFDSDFAKATGVRAEFYNMLIAVLTALTIVVGMRIMDVCEEILGNSHVAIYSIKADSTFARLYVCSRRCTGSAEKSLKITDYPELLECLKNNETFFNRKALKNYPAYATPIRREGVLVGMLLIMEADYTQMNMEFSNKLRIMSDLIQDSLVRAMEFYEMGEKVIEDTRILEADKFEELLDVKKRMRRKQYSDYVLLEIEVEDDRKLNEISRRISGLVRENDVLGIGKDGKLCLLLSQTSSADMKAVAGRLLNSGIEFEQVRE